MQLKPLVKVSAITNLADARYCAGMDVAMMGFSLDHGSTRYVSPEQFEAITQWIEGVALVGELNDTDPTMVNNTLDQYTLDYLQLNHPIALPDIKELAIPVVLKINLRGDEKLPSLRTLMEGYTPYIKYFLLETTLLHEGAITSLQPTIDCLADRFPILQGYHIATDNLPDLLNSKVRGIALQWGVGTKSSDKDFELMVEVL